MNKPLVFVAGVYVGIWFERNRKHLLPFRWKCTIEGCGFRTFATSPNDVMDTIQRHKREKHPGREIPDFSVQ